MMSRANGGAVDSKIFVSLREMAEMLGIGTTKANELLRDGAIESVRLGRKRLIPVDAVTAFSNGLRERQARAETAQDQSQGG